MKKLILLIVLTSIFIATSNAQSCLPEGIKFSTQNQIDNFQTNYPDCTEIEGDVKIGDWESDITNLNGLSVLTSIGGEMSIHNTQFLTNLSDLDNLISIGDGLVIGYNESLQNLAGLNNITSIDGPVTIYSNNELTSLIGLEGLTSVEGNLEITGNEKLMDLSGLENLASLGANLIIGGYEKYPEFWVCNGNSSLNNISSLSKLTSITGDLCVNCNTSLTDLYGLHNIASVGGDLIISSNDSLVNLLSLSHLDTIYGNLEIGVTGGGFILWKYGNPNLTDLSGLDNLKYIGGDLNILGNDSLNSLSGLDDLNAASFLNLSIIHNANLSACEAQSICSYLASPNGIVEIRNNAPGFNNPGEAASVCGFSMPCLPYGNYFLLSQSDVDNFQNNYQGCKELEGNVIINGDDITNLYGLNGVTSLSGSLKFGFMFFGGNPSLSNLEGLEGLNSIGNILDINNSSLFDLTGLNNLGSIGGNLSVENNRALTNLSGLENLDSIGGGFYIEDNDSLTSLTGLDKLVSIGGRLWIEDNDSLTSLAGLDNLVSVRGRLSITFNNALTSLAGLGNIDPNSISEITIRNNLALSICEVKSICEYLAGSLGSVSIYNNAPGCNSQEEVEEACASCLPEGITFTTQAEIDNFQTNYPNCTEIEGDVFIYGADISDLNGLNVLTMIDGSLNIGHGLFAGNKLLNNLTGLDNLIYIGGGFTIYNNVSLKSLTGLEKLNTIEGNLSIGGYSTSWGNAGNPSLANLIGFESLTSIDGFMKVEFNDALTSLSGLSNLISIAGGLIITNNQALKNLEGLAKIDANSITKLVIVYNDSLATCDVESICDYLAIPNATIEINDNAPGCNSQAEVDTVCKYSFVDENSFLNELLIHPNPFSTSTTIEFELTQPGKVELKIYNQLGELIEINQTNAQPGKQTFTWDASNLPSGIYFIRLQSGNGVSTQKVVKL